MIEVIKTYGRMTTGTMEETNSKVYVAHLKVWGCAWSERGALAMMRIRATLASQRLLVDPAHNQWFTEKKKANIQTWHERKVAIPETEGYGWEPPRASIPHVTHMPPKLYGMTRC